MAKDMYQKRKENKSEEDTVVQTNINWFPGHMAKTRRMLAENLSLVDIVIELRDARIPQSSANPEIRRICDRKPMLTLLGKAGLADPARTKEWCRTFSDNPGGDACIAVDCITGYGIGTLESVIRQRLTDKLARYEDKGMSGRRVRAMIVGIPNVGKSTLINRLTGQKKAKAEDRPGVTRDKQWIPATEGLNLLDTPGVLWPKFEDRTVGENLALTGSIRDGILDIETLAVVLVERLRRLYPGLLCARYKLDEAAVSDMSIGGFELFELIGRKRGYLISGGEINGERTAVMLLDEFRGGIIGRISLE